MRRVYLLLLVWLTTTINACTQPSDQLIADRLAFCDSNFPENLIPELKEEFNQLEQYFVQSGLLTDKSGESYYTVYQKISKENDLIFNRTQFFPILDSLDYFLLQKCFYKLLTEKQLLEMTPRHLKATEAIAQAYEGNVTPGMITKRITDRSDLNFWY